MEKKLLELAEEAKKLNNRAEMGERAFKAICKQLLGVEAVSRLYQCLGCTDTSIAKRKDIISAFFKLLEMLEISPEAILLPEAPKWLENYRLERPHGRCYSLSDLIDGLREHLGAPAVPLS